HTLYITSISSSQIKLKSIFKNSTKIDTLHYTFKNSNYKFGRIRVIKLEIYMQCDCVRINWCFEGH
uniref:Uncharacterized protein n=1 Tax=Oryza brachyantha TaxID=4533 RepID=J3NC00_ORYBR